MSTTTNSSSISEFFVDQQSSCVMGLVYCFIVYLLHRYLGSRFERGRERELSREHRKQCEVEQDAIAKLRGLEHELHRASMRSCNKQPSGVPQRPRTKLPGKKQHTSSSTSLKLKDSHHFVSLSMSPIEKDLCSHLCEQKFSNHHSIMCKLGEHRIFQTQIELSGDVLTTLNKLAEESLIGSKDDTFLMQLGRIQVYLRSRDNENKVELLKLDEIESVPVVLQATYVAGTVTIYGSGLTGANLMLATSTACIMLETVSQEVADGLEKHTCVATLPSVNITELFVYATKCIDVQGYDVRVSSLVIPLQDDNWRQVFRSVIPVTVILLYMVKQMFCLLSLMGTVVSVFIWLPLPILLAQYLPKRAEVALRKWCKKIYVRVYLTLYFASLRLIQERDSQIPRLSQVILSSGVDGKWSESVSESTVGNNIDEGSKNGSSDSGMKKKEGSVRNSDWQWPIYDRVHSLNGEVSKKRRNAAKAEEDEENDGPFEITYRNQKGLPWAAQVDVKILSRYLMKDIEELMPGDTSVLRTWSAAHFFFIHKKLKDRLDSKQNPTPEGHEEFLHLKHFLRFLDKELEKVEEEYESMKSHRRLSHDMLWAFFPPDEIFSFPCSITHEKLCATVQWTYYTLDGTTVVFHIRNSVHDYDCESWSKYTRTLKVKHFEGDIPFDDTSFPKPLWFMSDNVAERKEEFLALGRQFCELSMLKRSNFKNYQGHMYKMKDVSGQRQLEKKNADGRVMIDLGSFSKMNPDYDLESARPPSKVLRGNRVETVDITKDPTRMFAPRMVYGFSFRHKEWGSFNVSGFSDVVFNESAFETLVMDEATKDFIESLVREHLKGGRGSEFTKGEGCILLCSGPPGTGKTLTAESLAEKLHCPLWSLSVAELGTTPSSLESRLVQIMDVAVQWGALVLLDEADIYLERRTSSNLERNAMTGVFLRQLEYFRGVLFLTTNRDIFFDEAFCSRISIFLSFEKHSKEQRSEIWRNLLELVGLTDVPPDVLEEFVQYEFNGREIRNVVHTAQTVARSKTQQIDYQHILRALRMLDNSMKRRAWNSQVVV